MVKARAAAISIVFVLACTVSGRCEEIARGTLNPPTEFANTGERTGNIGADTPEVHAGISEETAAEPVAFSESLSVSNAHSAAWVEAKDDSAKFPKAYQIPGTDVWWKSAVRPAMRTS
ncbi:MAG: hypothetical protein AB7O26_17250 [Planctomycetaceae bacterium]